MARPSNPIFVGQHFYFQAFSLACGATPLQVISSDDIDFLIGVTPRITPALSVDSQHQWGTGEFVTL